MRFIRKNGKVIPIRDDEGVSTRKAGVVGAAAGAGYHVHQGVRAARVEKLAKNSRTLKNFKKNLKEGDILVMGSSPKYSGGHELADVTQHLPKPIGAKLTKLAKSVGIKTDTVLASNSTILTAAGAGNKYHAGVYLGNGKVAHMTTDYGATIQNLHEVADKQNITAMRFANASSRETQTAIKFAKKAVASRAQYKQSTGVASAFSNLVLPVGKKVGKGCEGMVCHTLPIRAYGKRTFGLGEHTFAGDFMKTPGITAIARRDIIKSNLTSTRAFLGNASKGLKWGVAAALGAGAINYAVQRQRRKRESR